MKIHSAFQLVACALAFSVSVVFAGEAPADVKTEAKTAAKVVASPSRESAESLQRGRHYAWERALLDYAALRKLAHEQHVITTSVAQSSEDGSNENLESQMAQLQQKIAELRHDLKAATLAHQRFHHALGGKTSVVDGLPGLNHPVSLTVSEHSEPAAAERVPAAHKVASTSHETATPRANESESSHHSLDKAPLIPHAKNSHRSLTTAEMERLMEKSE